MFERLLEFFFHAKAGALAGILLIGTTGALVTATVSTSNGVTTVTLTQASASPSAATLTVTSPSPTASPTTAPTGTAAAALISSSTKTTESSTSGTTPCDDTAHAAADAVKTVNAAFSKYHTDLMHMRSDSKTEAARKIIEDTDKLLKSLRQSAVKDIHATSSCAKADDDEDADEQGDEDNDNDEDNDENDSKKSEKHSEDNFLVVLLNNLFGKNTNTTTTMTTLTTTGDPQTIADNAVAAMKLAFDDAVAQLQALPSASPKPTKSPQSLRPDDKGKADGNSGKGNGKGNSRGDRGGDD